MTDQGQRHVQWHLSSYQ